MHVDDAIFARLTAAQRAALQNVEETVRSRQPLARARVVAILSASGCREPTFDAALDSVRQHARVVVHFHPDRIGVEPITVAEALLADGQYRSQFETGLSSGSLTAFPGGARDAWEETLFGGAYHAAASSTSERPKYGALELIRYPDGPWPRFGSCYFVLRQEASRRTSFTFSGSEQPDAADRLGTIDRMESVLAPLLAEVASGEGARVPWPPFVAPTLGVANLTVASLLKLLAKELAEPRADPSVGSAGRVLDTGIEAQVHGPIDLSCDIEMLVGDRAFAATPTGDSLRELCHKYSIPLRWHAGFRLPAQDVPDAFRGPEIARLARHIAGDGMIDAAVIGAAERSLRNHPDEWREWGTYGQVRQYLKQLWHVLVHYGSPGA